MWLLIYHPFYYCATNRREESTFLFLHVKSGASCQMENALISLIACIIYQVRHSTLSYIHLSSDVSPIHASEQYRSYVHTYATYMHFYPEGLNAFCYTIQSAMTPRLPTKAVGIHKQIRFYSSPSLYLNDWTLHAIIEALPSSPPQQLATDGISVWKDGGGCWDLTLLPPSSSSPYLLLFFSYVFLLVISSSLLLYAL